MMFWIVLGVTAALAALWIAWPFLRSTTFELTGAEGSGRYLCERWLCS